MKKSGLAAVFAVVAVFVAVCIGGVFAVLNRPSQTIEEGKNNPPLPVVFNDLNFAVEVPGLMRGHLRETRSQWGSGAETATRVNLAYESGDLYANVIGFEEMPETLYEKMQAEGGPMGTMLGKSKSGRVVLFWGPQSNPFNEGTPEYLLFCDFPRQLKVVFDSFRFLDE